jgi:hypothetical protein
VQEAVTVSPNLTLRTVAGRARYVKIGVRRLVATCLVLAALAPMTSHTPAYADASTPNGTGIEGRIHGWRLGRGGPPGGRSSCSWVDIDSLDYQTFQEKNVQLHDSGVTAWAPYYADVGGAEPQPIARWLSFHQEVSDLKQFIRTCNGVESWVVVPVVNNPPGVAQLIPGDLRDKYTTPPVLDMWPRDREFGWAYVHVPVEVHTTRAQYKTITVTAHNDPQNVPPQLYRYVTVTATPYEFKINGGGGAVPTSCQGDAPVTHYPSSEGAPCSLEFKHESSVAGGTFPVHGEIVWRVTYISNFGPPGVLNDINRGNDGQIAVAAIKALVRCTGAGRGGC